MMKPIGDISPATAPQKQNWETPQVISLSVDETKGGSGAMVDAFLTGSSK